MPRLIDADALISDGGFVHEVDNEVYWEKEDIDHAPTIEAEPVKHGRWKRLDAHKGIEQFKCSICRSECYVPTCMGEPMYCYCPNCGCRMDGGVE